MATSHHVPQVVVTANGQRSACYNCDFEYRENLTPSVVEVTPANGLVAFDQDITIIFDVRSYTETFENTVISLGGASLKDCGEFLRTKTGTVLQNDPTEILNWFNFFC